MKKQIISNNVINTLMNKNKVVLDNLIPNKPISKQIIINAINNSPNWKDIARYQTVE